MAVVDSTIADTSAAVDSLRNFTLYFWRVRAGDASGKGGWSAVSRVTVSLITRAYGVDPGWNLVSLPLLESDRVKNTLFPQAISPAFAYDSGSFVVSDTLENGRGYWMKFASALSVAISGASSTTETVSVAEGWNLIGALSAPIAAFSVTSLPAGIMTSYVFGFRGHYVLSDSIYPMRGYWVKSGQPGSIVLSTESPAMSLAKNADDEELKYASSFTFSDKTGARITLYLVPQMSGHVFRPDRYELPPAPRESVFDIRFASNRFAETVDPKCVAAMPVILRSTTPPVTLEWNVDAMNVSLETGGRRSSMTGSGKIQLNNGLSSLSLVTGVSPTLPVAFSVGQNYPNPFNPVTVIRYSVPVTREANVRQDPILSHISLKVYDMLGQLVATLVDDTKAPGEYTARWDASNAPSGIYYYRFVAGGFTDIKKMVYLK
jgi:hypothetical protein